MTNATTNEAAASCIVAPVCGVPVQPTLHQLRVARPRPVAMSRHKPVPGCRDEPGRCPDWLEEALWEAIEQINHELSREGHC